MAEDTKVRDNVGDQHDDGLWPDFEQSAESSVHENLPQHFGEKDNLYPDEELSLSSVEDGAKVLAERGFGKDELYPDEELSKASAEANAEEYDAAREAVTPTQSASDASSDSKTTEEPKKTAKKTSAAKPTSEKSSS